MTNEGEDHITLDDVASDRKGCSEAHARLKARALWEWFVGGTRFSAGVSLVLWLLQPNTPAVTYFIVVGVSYTVSAFAVLMNMQKVNEWYRGRAAELDTVESQIRAGEMVSRPNPPLQPTGNNAAAERKR